MKDRIKSFEDRSNGVGCMIAGGRCGLHHCKVVREIVQKRMSSTDKFGNVVWKMGEGTILVCPAANKTYKGVTPGKYSTAVIIINYYHK